MTGEFTEYIADHLNGAREENAVIGAIDEGRFNGRPLTQEEQVGMIALLIAAGHETTVHGIGAMIYYLATVDGLKERLIADPALIPPMIDESLRMEAPIVSLARTVRGGAELAGQKLEDGDRVLMVFSAANHDPAVFDRPEEFVCPRERNPHVAFGSGVHRCLGEHLALLEMRIITEELLAATFVAAPAQARTTAHCSTHVLHVRLADGGPAAYRMWGRTVLPGQNQAQDGAAAHPGWDLRPHLLGLPVSGRRLLLRTGGDLGRLCDVQRRPDRQRLQHPPAVHRPDSRR